MIIVLSFLLIFLTILIIPIFIYAIFAKYLGVKEPDRKAKFFAGVILQKLGTAFGFLSLFVIAADVFNDKWLIYAGIWFVMFAITEIGQAYLSDYSKKEAVAGIISEAIYFPLAALVTHSLL
jgi:hypothetical protein